MDFDVTLSPGDAHISVRVRVPVTLDVARGFLARSAEKCREHGLSAVLIDVRGTTNVTSDLENYRLMYGGVEELGFPRTTRVAVVVDPEDETHDFIETLTRNAGYLVRLFTDGSTAAAWLRKRDR